MNAPREKITNYSANNHDRRASLNLLARPRKLFDLNSVKELPFEQIKDQPAKKFPRDFQVLAQKFRILLHRSRIKRSEFTVSVNIHMDFLREPYRQLLDQLADLEQYSHSLPSLDRPFMAMGSDLFIVGTSTDVSKYTKDEIDIIMDDFVEEEPLQSLPYSHISYVRFTQFVSSIYAALSTNEGAWNAYKRGGVIQRDLKTDNCSIAQLRLLVVYLATTLNKSFADIERDFTLLDSTFSAEDLNLLLIKAKKIFT